MAHRARSVTTPVVLGALALTLSACASNTALLSPKYPTRLPSSHGSSSQQQAQNGPPSGWHSDPDHKGGTWKPYQVNGRWYYPAEQPDYDQVGTASWYGDAFNGKPTADGEIFDMLGFSAAHKTLPLPSIVEVTNLDNGKSMQVRVNDRGPFVDDRLIDLSKGAADKLGVLRPGLAHVRVRYVGPAGEAPAPSDVWHNNNVQFADAAPPPRTPRPPSVVQRQTTLTATTPPLDPSLLQPLHVADPDEVAAVAPPPALIAPAQEAPVEVASLPPPIVAPLVAPAGHYAIQAAAFANRANAEKAASQLASVGPTDITPVDRNGTVLYRVFVRSLRDANAADDALDRVAAIGYPGAVIVAP